MVQKSEIVRLQGGLDLVTPAMSVTSGRCIAAQNYEVEARGYRRITGYERMDGRPRPSDATYLSLSFDAGATAILEDDVVTGLISGATGIAVSDAVLATGLWDGTGTGTLYLYNTTGAFQNDENLQVSAATVAESAGISVVDGATTDAINASVIADVTAKRRTAILVPAGSGGVLGVATYLGAKYCWRNNAGATAAVMFKATTTGWAAQALGDYIKFTAGTTIFTEGETVTGTTSTETATVERVVLSDGAWDGSGTGILVLSSISGPFNASEAITSAGGAATTDGAEVAITLPAGGTYRHVVDNFYASSLTQRLYFVNGVGRAIEWDGTIATPVFTGLTDALDTPTHVGVHALHLFLSFTGGSLQNSSTGLPLVFDGVSGAAEIGFGQEITNIESNHKDSLLITGRNKIGYLTGTSDESFVLKHLSGDSGGIADTMAVVGDAIFMDDQGVREMKAVQAFGDWKLGTATRLIEPLLASKKLAGITPVGAFRVRSKDQYRLYFSDMTGIVIYFGRKDPEVMTITLGFTPTGFASGEDLAGNEILLAAGADGYVYELDRGTSFDGTSIEAFMRTSFLHQNSPNVEKRYHRARLEGRPGSGDSSLAMSADFGYGNSNQPASNETAFTFFGVGGFWEEALWNEFAWSSQVEGQAFAELDGLGENVSVVFMSDSAIEVPHSLSTLTINYSIRRKLR